jgi:phosphatidylglycerol lysyltransferase
MMPLERAGRARKILVLVTGILTLASGLLILRTLIAPSGHSRVARLLDYTPFEFRHLSRFLTLVLGFALAVTSVNLLRRKRRAFYAAVILAGFSVVLHLLRGRDLFHAVIATALLGLLFLGRRAYTVGSGLPDWRSALLSVGVGLAFTLTYGIAGFWWLDERHFGGNFNLGDSIRHTMAFLALVPEPLVPPLRPLTSHALWFADSLHLMTLVLLAWVVLQTYRPVVYRFRTQPQERHLCEAIVRAHGRCALDYFKYWPDKSYYVSASGRSVIAYRVSGSFAVALADPVGPEEEVAEIAAGFIRYCRQNDWGFAFHQALPDFLPVYQALGLKHLKIGDDAVIDLTAFSLDGKGHRGVRHTVSLLERNGDHSFLADPPLDASLLTAAKEVSDAWLGLPGRRERGFTLGRFDEAYLRATPFFGIRNAEGRLLAFANLIPSFAPGESTIDLMRHRPDAPNGTMDFLFVKLFLALRDRGFTRFNLGMAPMSGFDANEEATAEERAVHLFFQQLNFLFSFRGLKAYKAKFASSWEPRYAVYAGALDLPRLAVALGRISALSGDTT